jgi:hypothetical protein
MNPEDLPKLKRRFLYAMLTYAMVAVLAGFTLTGPIRLATLVFLAGMALKTYIAVLKARAN